MSLSKSLLRAAKIQEKIDELRLQLVGLLDQARAEVLTMSDEDAVVSPRRVRPKMLKVSRGKQGAEALPPARNKSARTSVGKRELLERGRRGRSSLAGRKRAASPTGPLAPAVVKVLQARKQPMRVGDILAGLLAGGYQFNSSEPKKNLAARIYRLKGVKQISAGLFGLA